MTTLTSQENRRLQDLIAQRQPGHSLDGKFYRSDLVYQADLERIWRRGWLFAGHSCQIPHPGDYFTFQLADDSLIVARHDDGTLNALHNVCRHRGTQLCDQEFGHAGRFVCPYHQWVYARDGSLIACKGMAEADVDKQQLGLLHAHVQESSGMIFVSLDPSPPDFAGARDCIEAMAAPQGMNRAKVAKIIDYRVTANWKLVWENNRECYHCNVNHPQYIKANYDHYNDDDTSPATQRRIEKAIHRSEQKWADQGMAVSHRQTGMATFPDADHNLWYAVNRTALAEGYLSETMDGTLAAPLMGDYADPDVGTLRMRTMPNFWNHSSCDHAVSTRLLPVDPQRTQIRVTWLVDQHAVEGKDYQLEDLLPFWQLTSEQDWQLCQRAQRGVNSSHYVPGPYSSHKEYNVDQFIRWYLQQLAM